MAVKVDVKYNHLSSKQAVFYFLIKFCSIQKTYLSLILILFKRLFTKIIKIFTCKHIVMIYFLQLDCLLDNRRKDRGRMLFLNQMYNTLNPKVRAVVEVAMSDVVFITLTRDKSMQKGQEQVQTQGAKPEMRTELLLLPACSPRDQPPLPHQELELQKCL